MIFVEAMDMALKARIDAWNKPTDKHGQIIEEADAVILNILKAINKELNNGEN